MKLIKKAIGIKIFLGEDCNDYLQKQTEKYSKISSRPLYKSYQGKNENKAKEELKRLGKLKEKIITLYKNQKIIIENIKEQLNIINEIELNQNIKESKVKSK